MTLFSPSAALSVVAVDDEQIALEGIVLQLSRSTQVGKVKGFTSAQMALDYVGEHGADVAFVDINMRGMNGLTLAQHIKKACCECAIVFLTGYAEFAVEAFKIKANGYVLKPASQADIERELEALRISAVPSHTPKTVARVQTFGDFGVFVNDVPVRFPRQKSKEIFAYLIDRRGSGVTSARLAAVIWEGKDYGRSIQKQVQTALSDLSRALEAVGAAEVIKRSRNHISVDLRYVDCDYYRFLAGDPEAMRLFAGEYMAEYSWAEGTAGELSRIRNG